MLTPHCTVFLAIRWRARRRSCRTTINAARALSRWPLFDVPECSRHYSLFMPVRMCSVSVVGSVLTYFVVAARVHGS